MAKSDIELLWTAALQIGGFYLISIGAIFAFEMNIISTVQIKTNFFIMETKYFSMAALAIFTAGAYYTPREGSGKVLLVVFMVEALLAAAIGASAHSLATNQNEHIAISLMGKVVIGTVLSLFFFDVRRKLLHICKKAAIKVLADVYKQKEKEHRAAESE